MTFSSLQAAELHASKLRMKYANYKFVTEPFLNGKYRIAAYTYQGSYIRIV